MFLSFLDDYLMFFIILGGLLLVLVVGYIIYSRPSKVREDTNRTNKAGQKIKTEKPVVNIEKNANKPIKEDKKIEEEKQPVTLKKDSNEVVDDQKTSENIKKQDNAEIEKPTNETIIEKETLTEKEAFKEKEPAKVITKTEVKKVVSEPEIELVSDFSEEQVALALEALKKKEADKKNTNLKGESSEPMSPEDEVAAALATIERKSSEKKTKPEEKALESLTPEQQVAAQLAALEKKATNKKSTTFNEKKSNVVSPEDAVAAALAALKNKSTSSKNSKSVEEKVEQPIEQPIELPVEQPAEFESGEDEIDATLNALLEKKADDENTGISKENSIKKRKLVDDIKRIQVDKEIVNDFKEVDKIIEKQTKEEPKVIEPKVIEPKVIEPKVIEPKEKPKPPKKKKNLGRYHVLYRKEDNKWYVKREGTEKIVKVLETQREAIAFATIKSINQNTTMVIHKRDGKIRKTSY
ncbi:DUF2188 domain-containing protein [Mycoplasmatota bacterium WC30]